jgi:hypothetical protein
MRVFSRLSTAISRSERVLCRHHKMIGRGKTRESGTKIFYYVICFILFSDVAMVIGESKLANWTYHSLAMIRSSQSTTL